MTQYIDKDALVAEIKKIRAKWFGINNNFADGQKGALTDVLSLINTLEVKEVDSNINHYDACIQYTDRESAIKAHAEDYSWNIESELFQQLTPEQQKLWRKEIEQAVISGGYSGLSLAKDPRYKENIEVKEAEEEPVSEDLKEAAKNYLYSNILYDDVYVGNPTDEDCIEMFKAGAKWQEKQDQSIIELAEDHAMLAGMEKMKEEMMKNIWKPADGDDLPEIDREVIVLCKNGRVAFGHRPVEKFIARPIGYGRTEEYEVKTYDKGGWNMPDVMYWLDVEFPFKEE